MHVAGYTLILFIEMNIAFKWGLEYWKTACLSVNAGLEGDTTKGADFGEVSTAVNSMKEDILPPDINKSQLKFVAKDGKILYALKPIIGLGTDNIEEIIDNRPYSSFDDFYEKCVVNGGLTEKKTIILIKSGAFDNLHSDRRQLMINFVNKVVSNKDKLTMVQLPKVIHLLPKELEDLMSLYKFRNLVIGKNKVKMNKDIEKEFIDKYSKDVAFKFRNDVLEIDEKSMNKYYNKKMEPVKEWLKTEEPVKEYNINQKREYWKENCSGSVAEWEMETILFNTDEYAIDLDQVKERYDISDFSELKSNPVKSYNKRGFPNFEIYAIVGVVVDWNNLKKYISVLTPNDGVVIVKLPRNKYSYYSQKLEGDTSWYERGTKLILLGYKKGNHFQVKGDYIYKNPVIKIHGHRKYSYQNKKLEQ